MRYGFCVTLNSNVTISKNSITTGIVETLNYLPATLFFGIAVKKYKELLFSKDVRFSNGYPLIDNKRAVPSPLSLHKDTICDKYCYLHEEERPQHKIKQERDSFVTFEGDIFEPNIELSLKSAYERDLKKSKDEAMFSYESIAKGSKFYFEVDILENSNISIGDIESVLIGDKRVGKSKYSEFGSVTIEKFKLCDIKTNVIQNNYFIIYLLSDMLLIDKNGYPKLDIDISDLGSVGEIDFQKSFIKTRTFTPFISAYNQRGEQKFAISKGSVITIKNGDLKKAQELAKIGIGEDRNFGFGEIIINPSFSKNLKKYVKKEIKQTSTNSKFNQFVLKMSNNNISEQDILRRAYNFCEKNSKKFTNVTSSQLGYIRQLARLNRGDLIEKIEDFISNGIAKVKWIDVKELFLEEIKKVPEEYLGIYLETISKELKRAKDEK